jgi:D-tyrosyl-tRNA(Tyr) deacylase
MRFLIQRVRSASVSIDGVTNGAIGTGLVVFVGIGWQDTPEVGERMVEKTVNLRIFEDSSGRMNRSALDLRSDPQGEIGILAISQFTLYADSRRGRRPSFTDSASPDVALPLMDQVLMRFRESGIRTESGVFGAEMFVTLQNDGPVTIWLDSADIVPTSG